MRATGAAGHEQQAREELLYPNLITYFHEGVLCGLRANLMAAFYGDGGLSSFSYEMYNDNVYSVLYDV